MKRFFLFQRWWSRFASADGNTGTGAVQLVRFRLWRRFALHHLYRVVQKLADLFQGASFHSARIAFHLALDFEDHLHLVLDGDKVREQVHVLAHRRLVMLPRFLGPGFFLDSGKFPVDLG